MTIKELETRTGMARANIRFYEGEGLLTPRRLDNGYRDYSEEDARTLEKIKLLRQIQLDLDTIRKVQQGALTLEQALFVQSTKLEGDKAVIERAAAVCRELELSGVEYGALDPQPWLRQLEAPQRPGLLEAPSAAPEYGKADAWDGKPRACYCPWQRWLARMLDMGLYRTVFVTVDLVFFRSQNLLRATGVFQWLLELFLLAFTLAVEPFWLHFWGWTPGKWVFGLKLRDEDGDKLTLAQGWERSWRVAWEGYGLDIPFYELWRFWKCREMGLEGRDCPWDGEEGYRYTKEGRRSSEWAFIGVTALCVAAMLLGLRYSETPPNRGPLTAEQFAENYNYYFEQLIDQSSTGLPRLDENGHWAERSAGDGVVINVFGDTTVWDDPAITFTGGYVTAVTLRMESEDWMVGTGTRELLVLLALSGSADGTDLFRYDLAGWVRTAEETLSPWENTELDYRGLHISQRVEYSGYTVTEGGLWQEDENVPGHCEKTVTISVIDKNGWIGPPPG